MEGLRRQAGDDLPRRSSANVPRANGAVPVTEQMPARVTPFIHICAAGALVPAVIVYVGQCLRERHVAWMNVGARQVLGFTDKYFMSVVRCG